GRPEQQQEEEERKVELVAPNEPSSSAERTILADPTNFTIKHPLQNRWTLWYDNAAKKSTSQSWGENLKQIVTFDTVSALSLLLLLPHLDHILICISSLLIPFVFRWRIFGGKKLVTHRTPNTEDP